MAYTPAGGVSGYNTAPYDFASYGQFNNTAYDNSVYGDYYSFNQITPFSAWGQKNIWGMRTPPPGMSYSAYQDRINVLSDRFTNYAIPSTIGSAASIFGTGMFMYSDLMSGSLDLAGKLTGSASLTRAGASIGKLADVYGGLSTKLTSAIHAPLKYMFAEPAGQLIGTFGDDLVNIGNKFGGTFLGNFNNFGSYVSQGTQRHVENFLTWQHGGADKAKTAIEAFRSTGTLGWLGTKAISAPLYLGASIATFMGMHAVLDTAIKGGINASGVGIQYEQDKISDTFEGLSDRVLSGPSGYKSKRFAADIAQHIREKSFGDAERSGIMSYLGISDTTMGRFTGGWAVIKDMRTKTAQYALMAESGLLTKSNSAEEFIKKADAMYAAINKLGEALGQTTTKAMETARVLKSQGLAAPHEIANAGSSISTSAGMSGYSHNQVLAITGEASEAFRGTIFGQDMAFNMANNILRKTSVGASAIGDNAFDKLSYTLRGKDSMNVFGVKVASELYNASEIKSMMIASMFEETQNGFRYTGKINNAALSAALNGENNYLTDSGTLGNLNSIFGLKDRTTQRAAERAMTDYSNNLSYPQMQKFISAVGRMRGYESDIELWDQRFREQGLDPTSARNMAKIFTADTRIQESNYAYFEQKQQQLSNYLEKENTKKYKSGLSGLFFDYHEYTGRHTALAEAGFFGMAGMGAAALMGATSVAPLLGAGIVIGGAVSAYSNQNYFESIGRRIGPGHGFASGLGSYVAVGTVAAGSAIGAQKLISAGILADKFELFRGGISAVIGSGLGYVGSGYGQEAFSDFYKETFNLKDPTARFLGGVTGTVGSVLPTALLMGPTGAVHAVSGLGTGLWRSYSDAYLSPTEAVSQRDALQGTMSMMEGAERLRNIDPESYAAMSVAGKSFRSSIDASSMQSYFKKSSKKELEFMSQVAMAAIRGNLKGTPGVSGFGTKEESPEVSIFGWKLGTPSYRSKKIVEDRSKMTGAMSAINDQFVAIMQDTGLDFENLDAFLGYIKYLGGRSGGGVKIGSGAEKALSRIRAITNMSGDSSTSSSILNFLNDNYSFSKVKFVNEDGATIFDNFSNYVYGASGQSYEQASATAASAVKRANEAFAEAVGVSKDNIKFITAENAAGVAAYMRAMLRGDTARADSIEKGMGLGSSTVNQILAYKGSEGLRAGADKIFTELSNAVVSSTDTAVKQGMRDFVTRKGAILGDSLNAVSSYMNYLYTGQKNEGDMIAFQRLADNNFEGIQDSATREALREMYSTSNATDVLVQSANSGNWSVGQAREKIKSAGKLNSVTKNMMLSAMEGLSDTAAFSAHSTNIMKHINETVLRSNMGEASRSTSESVAQLQVEVLGRLDGSIKALNSILLATNLIKDENVRKNLSEANNPPKTTNEAVVPLLNNSSPIDGERRAPNFSVN